MSTEQQTVNDDGSRSVIAITENGKIRHVWDANDPEGAEAFVDEKNLPFYKEKRRAPWGTVVMGLRSSHHPQ